MVNLLEQYRHPSSPFSTLQERISKGKAEGPKLGRSAVFTKEQEEAIANHAKLLASLYHGLSPVQLRRIAFEFAERNEIKQNFSKDGRTTGKDWLVRFLKRNPLINIRKLEATSINRIEGFSKTEVTRFYNNLEEVMLKYKFPPTRIFNMDATVQDPGFILAPKGQKGVGSVASWERGRNITVLCTVSANGSFIPPMFIFSRQRMSPLLEMHGPPCAIYHCSKSGWTNEDLFMVPLRHFAGHTRSSMENPAFLILGQPQQSLHSGS
jgi:hypothetical protein